MADPSDVNAETLQRMSSLGTYALAMQAAQFLEMKLAILCVWAESDFTPRQVKNVEKAFRRTVRSHEHLFQRASASELRNRLDGVLPEELAEELTELIGWRDRLAHRYLREQYALDPPIFGERMQHEMQAVSQRFQALGDKVDAETRRIAAERGVPARA